jgi:hypothetical protein
MALPFTNGHKVYLTKEILHPNITLFLGFVVIVEFGNLSVIFIIERLVFD